MQAPGESNQFGLSGSFISCSDGSWDVNNPALFQRIIGVQI